MVDREALERATAINDAVLSEKGGARRAPDDVLNEDLGVDMLDLLGAGFDYSCRHSPDEDAKELRELLHAAYVVGAITMARAMKQRDAKLRRVA